MKEELKHQILHQLNIGRAKAIPSIVLANRCGLKDDRPIRRIIRKLIADGYPIVSSVAKPHGYFFAETKGEIERYLATLKSRLIEDAYRRRDLKRASLTLLNPEQMRLV